MRCYRIAIALSLIVLCAARAWGAEPPSLIRARGLYNVADYDAAIEAAAEARRLPEAADTAAVVQARAYLERYRRTGNAADLAAAHEALTASRASALAPRDYVDLLIGLGQYLYFTDDFGPSAEIFDSALSQAYLLNARERLLLLDWWANAIDRAAQALSAERRAAEYRRLAERMDEELRRESSSPVANYWLPVAARGTGDVERAWALAKAAWVRSTLAPETAYELRDDLNRFVADALIPELARARGAAATTATLGEEWARYTGQWQ